MASPSLVTFHVISGVGYYPPHQYFSLSCAISTSLMIVFSNFVIRAIRPVMSALCYYRNRDLRFHDKNFPLIMIYIVLILLITIQWTLLESHIMNHNSRMRINFKTILFYNIEVRLNGLRGHFSITHLNRTWCRVGWIVDEFRSKCLQKYEIHTVKM